MKYRLVSIQQGKWIQGDIYEGLFSYVLGMEIRLKDSIISTLSLLEFNAKILEGVQKDPPFN
jgi:hypothetical protein